MLRILKSQIFEYAKFIIVVAVVVIPIRLWVAQPFIVQGASMIPGFHNADYLIIDELSYNFREPKRGEVVIFRYPHDPSKFYIKRIIGLPSEKIRIENGNVAIVDKNNSPEPKILDENYLPDSAANFSGESTASLEVDEYFVMGDNRGQSSDSRSWGPLNRKFIVGRAWLRLWPFNKVGYLPGSFNFGF